MNLWTLTFRAEGDGPPVEIRIRRLLKNALRTHGLRCIRVHALPADESQQAKAITTHDEQTKKARRCSAGQVFSTAQKAIGISDVT